MNETRIKIGPVTLTELWEQPPPLPAAVRDCAWKAGAPRSLKELSPIEFTFSPLAPLAPLALPKVPQEITFSFDRLLFVMSPRGRAYLPGAGGTVKFKGEVRFTPGGLERGEVTIVPVNEAP